MQEEPHEDSGTVGMDAKTQYKHFQVFVEDIVEERRKFLDSSQDNDWLVSVYDDIAEFVRIFPDRIKFHNEMMQLIADVEESDREIDDDVNRLQNEGLGYLDYEFLKYEFPPPPDHAPDDEMES